MDSTIIHITPKTPRGSNSRHAYQGINAEGDAYEFIEFPQGQPLRVSLPDSDTLPKLPKDGKHSQGNRRNARLETSRVGFQLRALLDWKWETASCVLAVGSLLAIIATVYPYNGHPLPQWPYGLSINSLISIYTTIMKAAMYSILAQGLGQLKWTWFGSPRRLDHLESFDDASRGALGAAKLVWVLRGRNPITIIGALVTIFAIAIDPFTQQLVHYHNCSQVVQGAEPYIPKTNLYDNPGGHHVSATERTVNTSMQAALYAGIFSPGTNRVSAYCPTGNCTFPELYKTIGYCTACSDITSQLNKTIYNYTRSTGWGMATNYTLPSRLHVSNSDDVSFIMGPGGSGTIQAIMAAPKIFLTCSDEWPWGCTGVGAAECQISLCIKTFNASVQFGNFSETEVSSGNNDTWYNLENRTIWSAINANYISTLDMTCLNNTEKETLRTAGYNFTDETKWLAYNTSLPAGVSAAVANASGVYVPANYTELPINASCIYQTTPDTVNSMNTFLFNAFSGQVVTGPDGDPEATASYIDVIYNSGNVSAQTFANIFQSVTDSMTTNIRNYADAHTPNIVTGIALESDTCVDSRWTWLTFPAALVLLTLVFFAAVIVQTRTRDAMVSGSQDYKNSALPLLFHGLEESITASYGQGEYSMAKMSQDANKLSVAFKPTDVGWRFVAEDKS